MSTDFAIIVAYKLLDDFVEFYFHAIPTGDGYYFLMDPSHKGKVVVYPHSYITMSMRYNEAQFGKAKRAYPEELRPYVKFKEI